MRLGRVCVSPVCTAWVCGERGCPVAVRRLACVFRVFWCAATRMAPFFSTYHHNRPPHLDNVHRALPALAHRRTHRAFRECTANLALSLSLSALPPPLPPTFARLLLAACFAPASARRLTLPPSLGSRGALTHTHDPTRRAHTQARRLSRPSSSSSSDHPSLALDRRSHISLSTMHERTRGAARLTRRRRRRCRRCRTCRRRRSRPS